LKPGEPLGQKNHLGIAQESSDEIDRATNLSLASVSAK
jgi:hypothetical protein